MAAQAAGFRDAAAVPAQQAQQAAELRRYNRQQQQQFACLPEVMSDFRRVLQAHTPVRPPLPAPVAASSGESSCSSGAPRLPPLPADVVAAAQEAGLLDPIPTQMAGVYAAAGADAAAALQRWMALTGQSCADLAPAGLGVHDARSAVPFSMGGEEAVLRLRRFLGLEGCQGGSKQAGKPQAPIVGYQDSRMLVRGGGLGWMAECTCG